MDNPSLANAFGTLGAVCWSVQLLPQIYLNYRRHNATGLPPTMMMFWAWAGVPLGVYNIVSSFNIALQIQPQILAVLSLTTWVQCYYYDQKWSIAKSLAVVVPVGAVMAGIEVGLVFALGIGKRGDVHWPLTLMAVLAAIFLALGVLRHYWDIYTHRTVRGISFLFVGIDALGDLTSIISVIYQPELDVLGLVIYGIELVLWLGVFAAGGCYNLIPWVTKRLDSRRSSNMSPAGTFTDEYRPYGIARHDMQSSTSVFHTPSSGMDLRERSNTVRMSTTGPEGSEVSG